MLSNTLFYGDNAGVGAGRSKRRGTLRDGSEEWQDIWQLGSHHYLTGGRPGMAAEQVTSLSESIKPLIAEFNRQRGKARLIALVSPT